MFSPWSYNIDEAARALLEPLGWQAPHSQALPTGSDLVFRYLEPLAAHPHIAPHIMCDATVFTISREGFDKMTTLGREAAPFVVRYRDAHRKEHRVRARAVIDASGTWFTPNPMGTDSVAVHGEREAAGRIAYGIPKVLNGLSADYAGSRVLVIGGGHSAINVVLDLLQLPESHPETRVMWALRHNRIEKLLGGGLNDTLPARGALGLAAKHAVEEKRLHLLAPFAAERIGPARSGLQVTARLAGEPYELEVDRIVVATGFRPDIAMLREIRVSLDPVLEAPLALAPLIDPNLHSCDTVPPHGAIELAHPEPGFYIVGSKSYGRAPTFLLATGYEQVRSVVAEIAGEHEVARNIRLVLPETGVCSTASFLPAAANFSCGGGPAPKSVDACRAEDAEAKAAGDGCRKTETAASKCAQVTSTSS
jgi:hypothetical protein